jgi:putative acetyltransferase
VISRLALTNYIILYERRNDMVILIGGASCTGKTTMAQRLLEKYRIPYLSIDHLKMGLIRGNHYCDFTATDGDDELTNKLWPIVKGIIKTNIENDQNIIIEGCYIPTDQVKDFEAEYREHIITLYIGFSEQYIENHFSTGIIEHRSETEYKDIDDYMNIDYFKKAHRKQRLACVKEDLSFFEVNEDYVRDLRKAYEWIDQQVSERKMLRYNK